mgnify:FL=1
MQVPVKDANGSLNNGIRGSEPVRFEFYKLSLGSGRYEASEGNRL